MSDSTIQDKEVSWKVLDIPICGTITAPSNNENGSAIVFVAGSGPTDRNWCSPLLPGTNGSARLLAEELAKRGYVTIRYDKMASGPHVRENLPKFSGRGSMKTHEDELAGAVKTLLEESEEISKDNLFALTNSEGAIHAVNYQIDERANRFKGFVLTGAPGRAIGQVSRAQISVQAKAVPNGDFLMTLYDKAIEEFLAGKPIVIDPALPEAIRPLLRSLENPNNLPFSRELWAYNLCEYISRIDEPILVLIGKKDIQIDWRVDGKALEDATTANKKISFYYPENANHILKHEELPLEQLTPQYVSIHYNSPDAQLDRETVDVITRWLNQHNN